MSKEDCFQVLDTDKSCMPNSFDGLLKEWIEDILKIEDLTDDIWMTLKRRHKSSGRLVGSVVKKKKSNTTTVEKSKLPTSSTGLLVVNPSGTQSSDTQCNITNMYSTNDTQTLKLFGAFRLLIVDLLFWKLKNLCGKTGDDEDDTIMVSFGSNDITSDYDFTFLGKYSPYYMFYMHEMCKKMFITYFSKKPLLSDIFDSNGYVIGYDAASLKSPLSVKAIESGMLYYVDPTGNENDLTFVMISPRTDTQKIIMTLFAYLKVYEANYLHSDLLGLTPSEKTPVKLKGYDTVLNHFTTILKRNPDSKDINNEYNQYFKYSKELYKLVHDRPDGNWSGPKKINNHVQGTNPEEHDGGDEICMLSGIGSWYSQEAYYTTSATTVVVLGMQKKSKNYVSPNADGSYPEPVKTFSNGLPEIDYVCSILENLGDLINHMANEIKSKKTELDVEDLDTKADIIISFSKYLYRIYYALEKISGSEVNAENFKKIMLDDYKKNNSPGKREDLISNWGVIQKYFYEYELHSQPLNEFLRKTHDLVMSQIQDKILNMSSSEEIKQLFNEVISAKGRQPSERAAREDTIKAKAEAEAEARLKSEANTNKVQQDTGGIRRRAATIPRDMFSEGEGGNYLSSVRKGISKKNTRKKNKKQKKHNSKKKKNKRNKSKSVK